MADILTITLNPTVDVSGIAETVRPVRKVRTSETRFDPGGGGINVARVVTRLGGDVEALYLAGGEIGSLLDRLLAGEGVARRRVDTAAQTRIGFIVHERTTGLEYRFVPEGAEVSPDDVAVCLDHVMSRSPRFVVCSGSLPPGAPDDIYASMAEAAAARGARFVLDTSGASLRLTLERTKVYLVKPSLGELAQLVGRDLDVESAADAAMTLVRRGAVEMVAVTLGADGAILASGEGVIRLPAIPVRVRSAVGAGDSFLGAMVVSLLHGRSTLDAFRIGVAAGAAAAMTPGTELCRADDVRRLFEGLRG